jgi:hypothetical protein
MDIDEAGLAQRLLQIQHVVLIKKWFSALHQSEQNG